MAGGLHIGHGRWFTYRACVQTSSSSISLFHRPSLIISKFFFFFFFFFLSVCQHELALLVTFYGVRAGNIAAVEPDYDFSSCMVPSM